MKKELIDGSRACLNGHVGSVAQECEEALRLSSQLPRNLLPLERAALQARRSVAGELAAAGLPGVASTWGGDWKQPPLAPQYGLDPVLPNMQPLHCHCVLPGPQ